jgi:hypothetical protein
MCQVSNCCAVKVHLRSPGPRWTFSISRRAGVPVWSWPNWTRRPARLRANGGAKIGAISRGCLHGLHPVEAAGSREGAGRTVPALECRVLMRARQSRSRSADLKKIRSPVFRQLTQAVRPSSRVQGRARAETHARCSSPVRARRLGHGPRSTIPDHHASAFKIKTDLAVGLAGGDRKRLGRDYRDEVVGDGKRPLALLALLGAIAQLAVTGTSAGQPAPDCHSKR